MSSTLSASDFAALLQEQRATRDYGGRSGPNLCDVVLDGQDLSDFYLSGVGLLNVSLRSVNRLFELERGVLGVRVVAG